MKDRYLLALNIAADAHYGQLRTGTTSPYIVHPISVAGVASHYKLPENTIIALLCHDVIEDGGNPDYYRDRIRHELGLEVLDIVEGLTDPVFEEGTPRKIRKKLINEKLFSLSAKIQAGKLCDIKDNTKDVEDKKPDFARTYLLEKKAQVMGMSDELKETDLWKDTFNQIESKLIKLNVLERNIT